MSRINADHHPLGFAKLISDRLGGDVVLTFSRYLYRPQSVFDEREFFEVRAGEVNEAWLEREIGALKPSWEIALNSKLTDSRGRTLHVGMIDFTGRPDIEEVSGRVRNLFGSEVLGKIWYYDSGRSLHGYIANFMGPKEWHQFLGRLLLMNEPHLPAIVDSRWIGHRILGGYAALRWSANSAHHTSLPTRISAIA